MPEQESEYLTPGQAARFLDVPLRTIQYRLQHGLMQGVVLSPRVHLIPRAEVERWRKQGKLRPGPKPRPR